MFISSTRSGLKPSGTFSSRMKVRISRPAPIISIMEIAIWETTNTCRIALRKRPPVEPRLSSRSAPWTSVLEISRAGISPNRMPVSSEAATEKARTRRSMRMGLMRGSVLAGRLEAIRMSEALRATPSAPLINARDKLSVRSCRMRLLRVAPKAVRMAISLRRATERESRRLATLAQAISSTHATAPNSSSTSLRTGATIRSCTGFKLMLRRGSASASPGFSWLYSASSTRISARACSSGRRKPRNGDQVDSAGANLLAP